MKDTEIWGGHYHGWIWGRRLWSLRKIRGLNLSFHPLLAQSMDDSGKIFAEHLTQLPLDLVLNEGLDNGYRIECAIDVHVLKWVCLED
jgi:hypothetical protein